MRKWKDCILADLGEIIGGATPSTTNKNYYGGDIAWITPKDLSTLQGRFIHHGMRNITREGLNSCSARLMPKHSVLFTSRAPIGYVAITENEVCTNQGFKSIIPNANTDYLFLYYLLVHNRNRIENMGSGTTFKEISGSVMKDITVSVPSDIAEQRTIAGILGVLDDKIENNKTINNHLEQIAQAIFKSWFVDFEPFGGKMPKDWQKTALSNVATLHAGGDKPAIYSPTKTDKCTIPVFSNGIDNFGLYGYTDYPKITEESVTISARGTIGFVCLRQEPFVPIVRLVTVIPNTDFITAKYLYLYFKSIHITGVGTTQQQLTIPDFKKHRILIPSINTIMGFDDIIKQVFDIIRHKNMESAHLAAIRDTLLPRLMSGELSVTDLEDAK